MLLCQENIFFPTNGLQASINSNTKYTEVSAITTEANNTLNGCEK
jgi:hypothetical protein